MNKEVLVEVDNVSKKFCRSLKRSLWYGVEDLTASFFRTNQDRSRLRKNEFWAVKDVSFTLRRGECLGLIGHNGAGKSTLLKMLNGLINPDEGSIKLRGRVGALIELTAGFNPILTGRENIYINGELLGFSKGEVAEKFDAIVDFAEIGDFLDTPVQNYSSGMKVRLGYAVAAQMEPDVLIIDEVLAVGDVSFKMKCYENILDQVEKGVSVIFVSHSVPQILRICNLGLVLNQGREVFQGSISKAIAEYENVYLDQKLQLLQQRNGIKKDTFIASVSLENDRGSAAKEFHTKDDVIIKVTLESKRKIDNTRVRIGVESPNIGPLGGFSSPMTSRFFDVDKGKTVIRVKLKSIPLQLGTYNIIVGWYGENKDKVLDIKNFGTTLKIVGPQIKMLAYGSDGTFLFNHEWL